MSEERPRRSKRPRGAYSRLICLGCRARRIRCELPSEVEIPHVGELRTVHTPCYRCKKLGIPCVVRQTILGRPGTESGSMIAAGARLAETGDIVSRIIIELPSQIVANTRPTSAICEAQVDQRSVVPQSSARSGNTLPRNLGDSTPGSARTLLIHTPQSTETVLIIRAIDTLKREKVEREWFRHLPAHVGHTQALDLSIKALVAACAYARGVTRLTSTDCYQALALALTAVQAKINQSDGELNDDILASTALLAPFEGVIRKHGIPTRLHVEGLAAILAVRPAAYPATDLAREIFDFHACDSSIMACIQGKPSPFERVARAYYANDKIVCANSDRAQLKGLGSELFVRIPRLVELVRFLRLQTSPQSHLLLHALRLSKSLLELQDSQAEEILMQNVRTKPSCNSTFPHLHQSLHFDSVDDFEALAYYWQNRLSLLRLERRIKDMYMSSGIPYNMSNKLAIPFQPIWSTIEPEMLRLVKGILMCVEYARALPLRKHERLLAYGMVVVWGAMRDIPMALDLIDNGTEKSMLSNMILRIVNGTLPAKPDLNSEDMDTAAEIFVGGQPRGRFAKLFGL